LGQLHVAAPKFGGIFFQAVGAQQIGAVGLLGPSRAIAAIADVQAASVARFIAFDSNFEQSFGGGKTTEPAADAALNFAGVLGGRRCKAAWVLSNWVRKRSPAKATVWK